MGQWSHSPLHSSSGSSGGVGTPSIFRRFMCPKQELRFDIDAPRNLLLLVEVFNILQETGKSPTFEREQLHQDLCVMSIRKRHRHHSFVNVPKSPGGEVFGDCSLLL